MTQQWHELALRPQPVEVARARRHVAEVFDDVDDDSRSTLEMLTSEVVTNAIVHADTEGEIVLCTSREADEARVEVVDASPRTPQIGTPSDDAECGRGLMLLEALASAWGVRPLQGRVGKAVWFTVRV